MSVLAGTMIHHHAPSMAVLFLSVFNQQVLQEEARVPEIMQALSFHVAPSNSVFLGSVLYTHLTWQRELFSDNARTFDIYQHLLFMPRQETVFHSKITSSLGFPKVASAYNMGNPVIFFLIKWTILISSLCQFCILEKKCTCIQWRYKRILIHKYTDMNACIFLSSSTWTI